MSPRPPRRDPSLVCVEIIDPVHVGNGTAQEGGGQLAGRLQLASRFQARIDDPGLPYLVELLVAAAPGGELVAEAVTVSRRPGGRPVVSSGMREVLVGAYLEAVLRQLYRDQPPLLLHTVTDYQTVLIDGKPHEVTEVHLGTEPADVEAWADSQHMRRPTVEALPVVAALYRAARDDPDPAIRRAPTQAVAVKLGYHRGHAARLVSMARKQGLLSPATPGRAGEAPEEDK